jgi:hypothetical protein
VCVCVCVCECVWLCHRDDFTGLVLLADSVFGVQGSTHGLLGANAVLGTTTVPGSHGILWRTRHRVQTFPVVSVVVALVHNVTIAVVAIVAVDSLSGISVGIRGSTGWEHHGTSAVTR